MTAAESQPASHRPPRVIFFTDNGLGLGHMTRLLAVARKAGGRFQPVAMTLSLAYPLLRAAGVPAEHFPSYGHVGMTKRDWSPLLTDRILESVAWTGAGVVVVDHVSPPQTFSELRRLAPDLHLIWSRRGLWREGKNKYALAESDAFQTIVEPGDVASAIDIGLTAVERERVVEVDPIVLVGPADYLTRAEARSQLGLPEEGRAFLLQLGEETADALHSAIERSRDAIRAAVGHEAVHLFAPLHPLHAASIDAVDGVEMRPIYPVARFFNAFDGVVSMAGYNSFHEIVVSGLPAVFLARGSKIDDQHRRARFAHWSGRAFYAEGFTGPGFMDAVARMVRADEPAIAAATSADLGPMNGAQEFANLIAARISPVDLIPAESDVVPHACGWKDLPKVLKESGLMPEDTVVVSTARLGPDEAHEAHRLIEAMPYKFILLGGATDELPNLAFESLMSRDEWELAGVDIPYERYVTSRISRMGRRYSAAAVIDLHPIPDDGRLRRELR